MMLATHISIKGEMPLMLPKAKMVKTSYGQVSTKSD